MTTCTVTTLPLQTTRKYHGRDHTVMDVSDVGRSFSGGGGGQNRIKRQRKVDGRYFWHQRNIL